MLEFKESLESSIKENAERVLVKELMSLLGKDYTLMTGYSEARQAFVVKVRYTPKDAFDLDYKYAQRTITIHDIVYSNCDILTIAIQSCIAELEACREEEKKHVEEPRET